MAKPEVMATQFGPAATASGAPCAKTGVASIRRAIRENSTKSFLFIVIAPLDFAASGWLTFHAMGGPHACGVLQNFLVLVRNRLTDVHHRQQHKDQRLNQRNA